MTSLFMIVLRDVTLIALSFALVDLWRKHAVLRAEHEAFGKSAAHTLLRLLDIASDLQKRIENVERRVDALVREEAGRQVGALDETVELPPVSSEPPP